MRKKEKSEVITCLFQKDFNFEMRLYLSVFVHLTEVLPVLQSSRCATRQVLQVRQHIQNITTSHLDRHVRRHYACLFRLQKT